LSRIRIFMLLATVVALAGALSACGGSDSSDEDPQTVIENATFKGVESGAIDVTMNIASQGEESGDVDVAFSGPFQSRGPEALPELSFEASATGDIGGKAIDFEGGVTLLADRAFIGYEGTEYEIDPTSFGFIQSSIEQGFGVGLGGGGGGASPSECQAAFASIDLNTVLDNLENEGSADVDGTSTTKVSGDLNPEGLVDAVIGLTEDPACSSVFEAAGPLPIEELEATRGEFSDAFKKAHAEVYVGDDGIIRKVAAELAIEPKGASGEKVEMDFELTLSGVNEEQTIAAPASAEPFADLIEVLGLDPVALLEAASSGGGFGALLEALGGDEGGIELPEGLPEIGDATGFAECVAQARSAAELEQCKSLAE